MARASIDLTVLGPIRLLRLVSRPTQLAILAAALSSLFVACSFNTDPAMHPPRGLALPPPSSLAGFSDPTLASTAPIQAQSGNSANAITRTALPVRPARSVVPDR